MRKIKFPWHSMFFFLKEAWAVLMCLLATWAVAYLRIRRKVKVALVISYDNPASQYFVIVWLKYARREQTQLSHLPLSEAVSAQQIA